jgi:AGCS family alanine or glycine:cation symporter
MALLGAVLKFAGCVLAVRYRRRNRQGTFIGGPMYYLAEGARSPGLAWAFAAFGVATAFTVGNVVQVNSLVLPLEQAGLPPLAVGLILAVAVGSVIVGGTQRIAHVVALVVPFMALLYLGAALLILIKHSEQLPDALGLVLRSSIALPSVAGGVTGYGIARAVSIGFERGVFATDAGAGIAPILQASAETDCPVTEGIVAMTAPIFVLLICTMTTLVLLVTGADQVPGLQSTTMCTWAFQHGLDHPWGGHLVTLSLTFFAYTTILAWAFCAARCVEYLWNRRAIRLFHCLFVLAVPLGALARVELVWACADLAMAGMLLCNIAGICLLRKEVQAEYSDYLAKEALERDTA